MQLVTVFKTFSSAEAQLIRSRLEAAGFQASVVHELAAMGMEGYSLSTGGILVQVPDAEVNDARALIESSDDEEGSESK